MTRDNLDVARDLIGAIGRRDLSALFDFTDPEIEWRSFFAALAEEGEYHGHDGMRRYVVDLAEAFEVLRPEVVDLLGVGEIVVGVGRIFYQGKGSGIEADAVAGWVFRFRNGKVVHFHAFRDPERVLGAVGLQE